MAEPDAGLREIEAIAAALDAASLVAEAEALRVRLAEGRFYLACVGQFKRGKSTLLNALVADPILPTGVVPVTATVTVLCHGERRHARVRLAGRPWESIDPATLAEYVTEARNPENRKGVQAAEVLVPSPLLASGLCLVDTPGLGSVFAGNAQVTREFVPHVDAALVVLGADPPISGEELALVEEVALQTDQLIVVLNKSDRLTDAERDEARRFAERVLQERLGRPIGRIFEVSAVEALAGQTSRDWKALEAQLDALARESGARLVAAAADRGIRRLADRLARVVEEHRQALVRPLDESERHLRVLRQAVAEAERALADLGPLFAAEQARLARTFNAEREAVLAAAMPGALARLATVSADAAAVPRRALRERAMEEARVIARATVEGWLREVESRAEALYREATRRFVDLADALLARLRSSGEALASLPAAPPPEAGFRARRQFYFTELLGVTGASLGTWLGIRLGSRRAAMAAARRDAEAYLERLIRSNTARVANDLADRVGESRRRLEAELAALLREVSGTAEHALEQARVRQAAGAEAVRAELARLGTLRDRLGVLQSR